MCSNANPLRCYALWALSVVYFQITHFLGRPHYGWDEYLYSVLEKVEVRMTVSVTVCVVWDDYERKGKGETRCRLIACSSRKAPRGPLGLTSPSDGRIAINMPSHQVPQNMISTQISESDNTRGYGHYVRGNPENEVGLIKYKYMPSQHIYCGRV